ncbi:hypothetical protein ACIBJI_33500 [Nocardia sp. NPDC050408]|uniref:hypothetical protein n=1 Tax=Nocardia sp. NPDC050408 TaxID=3364319 RepID=UPI0037B598E0
MFADLRTDHGVACLFISRDRAVVHQVADRVGVLREGLSSKPAPSQTYSPLPAPTTHATS